MNTEHLDSFAAPKGGDSIPVGDISSVESQGLQPMPTLETLEERRRRLIGIVRKRRSDPVATGFAISQLNQPLLYAPASSFEEFLKEKFDLSRAYANRLICYGEFAATLRPHLEAKERLPSLYLAEFLWKSWKPNLWVQMWTAAKVYAEGKPVDMATLRQLRKDDDSPYPPSERQSRQWPPRRVTTALKCLIEEVREEPELQREFRALLIMRDNMVRHRVSPAGNSPVE